MLLSDDKEMRLVLNAGGPDRLSRVQMAEAVAQVRGHDLSLIKHVSASSVCFKAFFTNSNSLVEYIAAYQSLNGYQLFLLTRLIEE